LRIIGSGRAFSERIFQWPTFVLRPASALTAAVPPGSFTRLSILPAWQRSLAEHLKQFFINNAIVLSQSAFVKREQSGLEIKYTEKQ
jgi:hypothetical protein